MPPPYGRRTGAKVCRRYAPRYLLQTHEAAITVAFHLSWCVYDSPQKRLQILKVPELIPFLMKAIAAPPPEPHPGILIV